MFYEENQIDEILICKQCRKKFDEPRILPCGITICSQCLDKILHSMEKKSDHNLIKCPLCQETHKIFKDAIFPVNKLIMELLEKSAVEVYRGDMVEKLRSNLKDIETGSKTLEYKLTNSSDMVKEHCIELRCDLDLATEIAIRDIHKCRDTILAQIEDYEGKAIASMDSHKDIRKEIQQAIQGFHDFSAKWRTYLKKVRIDEKEVSKTNELALELKEKMDFQGIKLESFIFNDQKIFFVKNEQVIKLGSLGVEHEGTFQFVIEGFQKFSKNKGAEVRSQSCIVRKLPWKIIAYNDKNENFAFFLQCDTEDESDEWSVNAKSELRLLHNTDPKQNFFKKAEHIYKAKESDWGFSPFKDMKEILDPNNGFYNAQNDTVTLEVWLKADVPTGI